MPWHLKRPVKFAKLYSRNPRQNISRRSFSRGKSSVHRTWGLSPPWICTSCPFSCIRSSPGCSWQRLQNATIFYRWATTFERAPLYVPSKTSLAHSLIMSAWAHSSGQDPSSLHILANVLQTAPYWDNLQSPISSWGKKPRTVSENKSTNFIF